MKENEKKEVVLKWRVIRVDINKCTRITQVKLCGHFVHFS